MLSSKGLVLATVLVLCARGTAGDQKCDMNFGFCQNIKNECSGTYLIYLCNGPYERKCCVPAFNDQACDARGGKCQSTSVTCVGGSYLIGLCGGPANRRCCVSDDAITVYNDKKCQQRGGTCQFVYQECASGNYLTGLCGGPANRLCCLPHVTANIARCGEKAKRLACELLNSPNVLFLDSRSTSATDKPQANLRDMCEGRRAIRSKKRCNSGCRETSGSVCIKPEVLEYLVDLKNSGRIVIDELTGACHPHSCSHQWGKAVDLHRDGRITDYIQKCFSMNGIAIPQANVLHCHF